MIFPRLVTVTRCRRLLASSLALLFTLSAAAADSLPFLSPLFADHMVLQRDKPNRFWGWGETGEAVTLTVANQTTSTEVDADGRWEIIFTPPPTGGPYTVSVTGSQNVKLSDVMVGDVWLCSGQSNMAVSVGFMDGADAVLADSDLPAVRFFDVASHSAYSPTPTPQGEWKVSTPETARAFSAVGFLLGQRLHRELGVPIGLVRAAVGGTAIECWISPRGLAPFAQFAPKLAELERLRHADIPREYGSFLMHWLDDYDIGQAAETPWSAEELNDDDWTEVQVPTGFDDLGMAEQPGVVWLRKTFELPDPLPAGDARLFLGQVEKMDTSYINGEWVGASSWVSNPRRHRVPAELLKPGKNVIALRIFKRAGSGGVPANDAGIPFLQLGDESKVDLAGTWQGKVSVDATPPHPMPLDFENYPTAPIVQYQGMLHPVTGLAIRGAVWYQGEANESYPDSYYDLMPALIADWRDVFGQGDVPFLVIGLPTFMTRSDDPGFTNGWATVRDAQWNASRVARRTAFVNTVDTGDPDDIHPRDKRPVGERAALAALGLAYDQTVVWQGPELASIEVVGGAAHVHFNHTDGGLELRGDTAHAFAVAGADRQWHWADVRVAGDTVVVSSPAVASPIAVRYAWQANPVAPLFNGAGLPAVPFRTDRW
ncbi:sialate O-acetylesterase [Synoicihabitans lomoniglobus]|uniref:Sialate O-acetylesterase n=1 Tax=Synoicihabitans lomoniglobus TaxID=2909285 RepID=A0AAE9ZVX6_9BACT|nr:hypothetical protein [Opitutaceae bacterium LMO-M01]WED63850.1 sialate O-acetylesterase [Opitutaceae bacterium LMO-M01]